MDKDNLYGNPHVTLKRVLEDLSELDETEGFQWHPNFKSYLIIGDKGTIIKPCRKLYTNNRGYIKKRTEVVKKQRHSKGYSTVSFTVDGRTYTKYVHRLVAETFLRGDPERRYINHIDGCKTNNCVINLEWVTAKENTDHAVSLGLISSGIDSPSCNLDEINILFVHLCNMKGVPNEWTSCMVGVTHGHIADIIKGYRHEKYTKVPEMIEKLLEEIKRL